MLFRVRKEYLAAIGLALAVLLFIIITKGGTAGVASAQPQTGKVIIIDPGHGGVDGGAVGVNGTVEKRINLEIALRLRDVFSNAGYTVIMTRDTDISIHDSSADSIREMKVSDLRNRLKLTRMYPDSLLISIHQNTLGNSSVTGAQVFYSPNNPLSAVLAQSIQDSFNSSIQLAGDRVIKPAGKNLYLFYNAENTAVLCECGFLSNSREEQLLCDPQHQDDIAYSIFLGTLEFLNTPTEETPQYG